MGAGILVGTDRVRMLFRVFNKQFDAILTARASTNTQPYLGHWPRDALMPPSLLSPGLVWQPQQLSWVISLCVRNGRKIKQERGGEGEAEQEQEQSRQQKAAGKGKQARPRDAGQKK